MAQPILPLSAETGSIVGRADLIAAGTGDDCRDRLHLHVPAAFLVVAVCEQRIGHFREHEQHSGVTFVESEVPGTGSVRKPDTAACLRKFPAGSVELVDEDHV